MKNLRLLALSNITFFSMCHGKRVIISSLFKEIILFTLILFFLIFFDEREQCFKSSPLRAELVKRNPWNTEAYLTQSP